MLGAGQREIKKPYIQEPFSSPFQGGYLRPPDLQEEPHAILRIGKRVRLSARVRTFFPTNQTAGFCASCRTARPLHPAPHEFEHGFESRCETVLTMERQS
jgi:hypothetical protein